MSEVIRSDEQLKRRREFRYLGPYDYRDYLSTERRAAYDAIDAKLIRVVAMRRSALSRQIGVKKPLGDIRF